MKIARAIQLHISADIWPAIISARNNIFPWDQKHLIHITPSIRNNYEINFERILMKTSGPLNSLFLGKAKVWGKSLSKFWLHIFKFWRQLTSLKKLHVLSNTAIIFGAVANYILHLFEFIFFHIILVHNVLSADLNNPYLPPSSVLATVDGSRWGGRYRRRWPVGKTVAGSNF